MTSERNDRGDRAWDTRPERACALAARLEQGAEPWLVLNQGTLDPALVRLAQEGC